MHTQMRTHVLIVDADPVMGRMLAFLLTDAGLRTSTVADPRRVLAALADHRVDLILLEAALPYMDAFALCTALRHAHPEIPVIFLTARAAVAERVEGLTRGADDYVTKPFEPTELLARIQAVLRRYRHSERNAFGPEIRVGDAALHLSELRFSAAARPPVPLTPTEMRILEYLMRNAEAVVSREALIERVWGYEYEGASNRVEVHIGRLRRKIETDPDRPAYICTVRDCGYTFRNAGPSLMHALQSPV